MASNMSIMTRMTFLALVAIIALYVASNSMNLVDGRSGGALGSCDLTPQVWPAANSAYGVNRQLWPNGRFGVNRTAIFWILESGIMNWVDAPRPTSKYTISFEGDASDGYVPGGALNKIHIRAHDIDDRYLGLVLYATTGFDLNVSSTVETRVGSWDLPDMKWFQLPQSCGGNVVTHANAEEKPMDTVHYWAAPVGTGAVRFRVLIKQGVQGRGSFWYPAQELALAEGVAPAVMPAPVPMVGADGSPLPYQRVGPVVHETVIGDAGVSCATTCLSKTQGLPFCDANAIKAIDSVAAFQAANEQVACSMPILAGCAFLSGPSVSDSLPNLCSYRSRDIGRTCHSSLHDLDIDIEGADVCYTRPSATRRAVCICSNDDSVMPPSPLARGSSRLATKVVLPVDGDDDEEEEDDETSSAPVVSQPSFLVSLVAAFIGLTGSSRRSLHVVVCIVAFFALVSSANGHNYFMSVHRATSASTLTPMPLRIGNQPHAQVIPHQEFIIEWSSGHFDNFNSPLWFAIVPLNETDQLKAWNIEDIFRDYILSAPDGSSYMDGPEPSGYWDPYFLYRADEFQKNVPGQYDDNPDASYRWNMANYFKDCPDNWIKPGDAKYIERPAAYRARAHPNPYTNEYDSRNPIKQCTLLDSLQQHVKRVKYQSEKYPWLEAVSQFPIPYTKEQMTYAGRPSIARFTVPGYHGAGDYVAYFQWQGYRDAMDINVRLDPQPIANVYGTAGSGWMMSKVDHCEIRLVKGYEGASTPIRRVVNGSAQACLDDCLYHWNVHPGWAGCNQVQVARYKNIPQTLVNYEPNLPWLPNGPGSPPECNNPHNMPWFDVRQAVLDGCKQQVPANYPYNDWANPADFAPIGDDDLFCVGADGGTPINDAVTEFWRITDDPLDPAYFSTCYFKVPTGGFQGIPDNNYEPPPFRSEKQAVDCQFQYKLSHMDPLSAPDWNSALQASFAGHAVNCEEVNSHLDTNGTSTLTADEYLTAMRGATEDASAGPQYAGMGLNADTGSSNSSGFPILYIILAVIGVVIVFGLIAFSVYHYRAKSRLGAITVTLSEFNRA